MEFWGVEVKPGESLKVQPEFGKLIHISQAALGEVKEAKAAKNVPLRLKVDAKNFIIGTLSAEDRTQLMFDLVLEKDFELSHDWKNGSVYFIGYTADDQVSDGEDFSDEFEVKPSDTQENGEIKPNFGNVRAAKGVAAAKVKSNKQVHPGFDEDEDDSESDSDDEMAFGGQEESSDGSGEDSEEDADGRSTEEELPKVQQSKKRPAEAAQEAPVPAKKAKAKSATPDKTASGKTPAGNKAKEQNPKSGGQHSCKSCNKSFNSEKSLQSHTKAKHESK